MFGPLPWAVSAPAEPPGPKAPELFVRIFGERDKPHGGNPVVLQEQQDRWDAKLADFVHQTMDATELLGPVGVALCKDYGLVPIVYQARYRGAVEWFVSFEKQQARWFQFGGWWAELAPEILIAKYQESLVLTWGSIPAKLYDSHAPGFFLAALEKFAGDQEATRKLTEAQAAAHKRLKDLGVPIP